MLENNYTRITHSNSIWTWNGESGENSPHEQRSCCQSLVAGDLHWPGRLCWPAAVWASALLLLAPVGHLAPGHCYSQPCHPNPNLPLPPISLPFLPGTELGFGPLLFNGAPQELRLTTSFMLSCSCARPHCRGEKKRGWGVGGVGMSMSGHLNTQLEFLKSLNPSCSTLWEVVLLCFFFKAVAGIIKGHFAAKQHGLSNGS